MPIFGRKGVADALRRETEKMRKRFQRLQAERARLRDMATRTPTGIPVIGAGTTTEELVERLRILTAQWENHVMRARVAQTEAEIEAECRRLEDQIAEMEARLSEPINLELIAPIAGQTVTRGGTLDIQWNASGPLGERLRIGLMKRGRHLRHIGSELTSRGAFAWPVPANTPQADDYQISIQDPTSGLWSVSGKFKIQ